MVKKGKEERQGFGEPFSSVGSRFHVISSPAAGPMDVMERNGM